MTPSTTPNIKTINFEGDNREGNAYLLLLALSFAIKEFNAGKYSDDAKFNALDVLEMAGDILVKSNLDHEIYQVISRLRESVLRDWNAVRASKEVESTFIYFAKHPITGHVKIGCSSRPKSRLSQIQVNIPTKLEIIGVSRGTHKEEQDLHRRFGKDHVSGEWFKDSLELRKIIASLIGKSLIPAGLPAPVEVKA